MATPAVPATVVSILSAEKKAELLDEFGDLDRDYREFKPRLDRYEELKKVIKPFFSHLQPEQAGSLEGHDWIIQATKQSEETKVLAMSEVLAKGGREWFMKNCAITLAALKSRFTPETVEELTAKERTGSRTLKAVPKAKPAVDQAA